MESEKISLKQGSILDLKIDSLAHEGAGVARFADFVIFLPKTFPGDFVRAKIIKKKKNFAQALPISILNPSPHRINAICSHANFCGGCPWQNLSYEKQLQEKRNVINDCIQRLGGFNEIHVNEVMPSPLTSGFRNKMEFSFSTCPWFPEKPEQVSSMNFSLGLHAPGSFFKVLPIKECPILGETGSAILRETSNFARASGFEAYDIKNNRGFWRFLIIRKALFTNQIMVNIVVSKLENKVLHDLSRQLLDNFPGISSIIATIHAGKGNAVRADSTLTLHGQDWFEEELDGLTYRINAFTFFQTNSAQALNLFKTAAELACSFTGNQVECVYDIYAGVGGISLFLARKAKKVLAFEISEESVQSGRFNAMHNNLTNIEFFRADAAELASYNTCSTAEFPDPQIVVVDPPRAGIHPELVKTIIHWQPETLVLVSCNAATLARDMKIFASSGYMPETVLPIDMFPHTYHCEIVVRMALRR